MIKFVGTNQIIMKTTLTFCLLCLFGMANVFAQHDAVAQKRILLDGFILDKGNKERIPFPIVTLYEEMTENEFVEIDNYEMDRTGFYFFVLNAEKRYKLSVNAREYIPKEVIFEAKEDKIVYQKDVLLELEEVEYYVCHGSKILNNIYFEWGSVKILDKKELDENISLLKKNPHIAIQMIAHLDLTEPSGGNENMPLSKWRVQAVIQYMIQQGIEAERLSGVYFEREMPIYTPERNEFESQTNRRMEFKITSMDYVSKNKK